MKTQVHTLRYGEAPWMEFCVPSLENWCKRHDYELIVWDDSHGYDVPKFVEKNMVEHFVCGDADRMVYIDADVFIREDAPEFPLTKGIALATDKWHQIHEDHFQEWVGDNFPDSCQRAARGWTYSNAGVWAADKKNAVELHRAMGKVEMVEFFQEQHWFNLCVASAVARNASLSRLSNVWNRYGRDLEPSWFHHLWGSEKEKDFERIQASGILSAEMSLLIHNITPLDPPSEDKTVVLEFIQDAGLGNQLFEWAAAYSICKTLNLPFRWVWKPSGLREFGLLEFGMGENYRETPYDLVMQRAGQGNRKLFDMAIQRIKESDSKVPGISCPFQDEKCFIDHADEIREIFMPEPVKLPVPSGTTPVGVQVRRGDYLKHSRLNVTTPEYFTRSMKWMQDKVENPHFIIVSDDPEWCLHFFGYREDTTVMPSQTPYEGIRTLASCKAHIISNSTFGWWGAWLGEEGPVVVPNRWYNPGRSYGDWEPVPDRWHKAPVGPPKARVEIEPLPPVIVKGLPDHERAIVYPWHADQERWHELRYSLRSVYENFEDKDCPIYILGTRKPGWLIESGRVKYIGAFTYREALTKGVQIAEKVLWMNDDIQMLQPTGWEDYEKTLYLKDIPSSFLETAPAQDNPWRHGCVRILKALAAEGKRDQKVFSTHTPYLFYRKKAMEVMEKYGIWEKFPMELAYFHHHAGELVQVTNEKTTQAPFGESRFLSFTDRTLTESLKQEIMKTFPAAPPWEMNVSFGI